MTAKEKAKELFDKYQDAGSKWYVDTTKTKTKTKTKTNKL